MRHPHWISGILIYIKFQWFDMEGYFWQFWLSSVRFLLHRLNFAGNCSIAPKFLQYLRLCHTNTKRKSLLIHSSNWPSHQRAIGVIVMLHTLEVTNVQNLWASRTAVAINYQFFPPFRPLWQNHWRAARQGPAIKSKRCRLKRKEGEIEKKRPFFSLAF